MDNQKYPKSSQMIISQISKLNLHLLLGYIQLKTTLSYNDKVLSLEHKILQYKHFSQISFMQCLKPLTCGNSLKVAHFRRKPTDLATLTKTNAIGSEFSIKKTTHLCKKNTNKNTTKNVCNMSHISKCNIQYRYYV